MGASQAVRQGAVLAAPAAQRRLPLALALAGAGCVLIISLLAWLAMERSEYAMTHLLEEKGASLIRALESALRSGMRSEYGVQLQVLLQEMAAGPDIEFVAVAMPDGTIVAHSEPGRLGEDLALDSGPASQSMPEPQAQEKWVMARRGDHSVFVVYRLLLPGDSGQPAPEDRPAIYLGLDNSPFALTRSQNRSFILLLSFLTMLAGLAGIAAVYYARRARESRLGQSRAEGEVHRLAEEVRRKEKLAAIGCLAAGVAHELRNPLSSIKGYATYFGQRFAQGSADREAADIMVCEVDRLNRVITDLIGLSRPSDVDLRPVALPEVVEHVLGLIRPQAEKKDVRLSFGAAPRLPLVLADPERLGQVLLNLCLNALDALQPGGRLTIACAGGRRRVWLMVRDNGSGIAPSLRKKIFDPYFTTKATGTGLGLVMVQKIVAAHGGELGIYSREAGEKGQGGLTIFRIGLAPAACAGGEGEEAASEKRDTGG